MNARAAGLHPDRRLLRLRGMGPTAAPGDQAMTANPHQAELAERRRALRAELQGRLPGETLPMVWEIGCGHGHFLAAYAAAHRGELCVGVDQELDRIRRAVRKQERARLTNLHFVRSEAGLFLEALPPGVVFKAVYVLFPDPWPKRRHHKHRLLQRGFMHAVADRAGEGTPFYFRTDHEPYFRDVETMLQQHPDWRLEPWTEWPFELATVFQVRAEKHYSLVAFRR